MNHYHSYNFLSVYQKIHNFCVTELGGFYLDVIKDRQYTTQVDSRASLNSDGHVAGGRDAFAYDCAYSEFYC